MTDEYLDAMRELWTAERPAFDGKFVSFDDVVFEPKPIQDPLPVWMGGRTHAALRRVAAPRRRLDLVHDAARRRPGDARVPARATRARRSAPSPSRSRCRSTRAGATRSRTFCSSSRSVLLEADHVLEQVRTIAGLGATLTEADVPLGTSVFQNARADAPPPTKSFADYLERIQWFAEEVMPTARAIAHDTAR